MKINYRKNPYGMNEYFEVPCTTDKLQKLPYAHYSDKRFEKPQSVYSDGKKGKHTIYSGRFYASNVSAFERGIEKANSSEFQVGSAAWYELFLCGYYQKNVILHKVLIGFNVSTLYEYQVFNYSIEK